MKLSISNIAWESDNDSTVYALMKANDFVGLEIAPTRIFPENPYDKNEDAAIWRRKMQEEYGFCMPSMQSIWYGRQEKIFGTDEERTVLLAYTKKAIDFAATIGCKNLVFGCPRNRNLPEGVNSDLAVPFFKELGAYALQCGTVIGMEANPPIYNTNYINDTSSALELIKQVDSEGFKLNLDVGTMIQNGESVSELKDSVRLINHVHISEPGLKPIEEREIHKDLKNILEVELYQGFVSIEMGKTQDMSLIKEKMEYIRGIFG